MNLIYVQVSMLGSRFAVLMLFTRIFKQWVLGVIGKSGRYRTCLKVQICCLRFLWSKDVSEVGLPNSSTMKHFQFPLVHLMCPFRCALAGYHFLDGVSADRHHTLNKPMETLQPRPWCRSHLSLPECEVRTIQISHDWVLPGMYGSVNTSRLYSFGLKKKLRIKLKGKKTQSQLV